MALPENEPMLGIHVRRGDAATTDLRRATRRSFLLEDYLSKADIICEQSDISVIYISTESEEEIERARRLRPQYRIFALHYDRSVFPRISETSTFIEDLALEDPTVIEPIIHSALSDLYFLQNCNAFIGTFNSEFSVLAWLLCIGTNGHLIPYINLHRRWTYFGWPPALNFEINLGWPPALNFKPEPEP